MTGILETLIAALRAELQQYGEILALLDQQHEAVMLQGVDEILWTIAAIHAQSVAIQRARETREHWQHQLSAALQQPATAGLTALLALAPEAYRPLLSALMHENNQLLDRVRERAAQNHALLRQAVDLLQRFITNLDGQAGPAPHEGEETLLKDDPTEDPVTVMEPA
jgi:hypothetical protein